MKIEILGIGIDKIDLPQTLEQITGWLGGDGQQQIVTINPEFVVAAQTDADFKNLLSQAALATCDGAGLAWAAKFLKKEKLERVTGVDLAQALLEHGSHKVYLLGGKEGAAKQMAEKYTDKVADFDQGGKLKDKDDSFENNNQVLEKINASEANILLVALPQVRQEKWIRDNLAKMPKIKVAIGVGGTFDFLSGQVKRAPLFLRRLGLEWLYRLIQEPRRLSRIYNATIKFGWLVLREKYGK